MEQDTIKKITGGSFLTTPINEANIFSRDDFTDEHKEIASMVQGFCKEHIAPVKEELEKKDKDLTFSLLKKLLSLDCLVLLFQKNMVVWN